jgi:hypothetical protein
VVIADPVRREPYAANTAVGLRSLTRAVRYSSQLPDPRPCSSTALGSAANRIAPDWITMTTRTNDSDPLQARVYGDDGIPTSEGFDYLTSRCPNGLTRPLEPGETEFFLAWVAAGALPCDAHFFRTRFEQKRELAVLRKPT